MVPADRAAMIEEFGKALRRFPKWAVAGAFDDWMANQTRRPSPGDIAQLATKRVRRLTVELGERRKDEEQAELARQNRPLTEEEKEERRRISDELLRKNGFNFKRFPEVGEGAA